MRIFLIILISFIYSKESTYYTITDSLPPNMPFSKKILWGENGVIRKVNLAPDSRVDEMKLRSEMLQLHQKLGLLNVGLMGAQMYLGNTMSDGNRENGQAHSYLGYTTFSVYMTTAGLQLFAPPAFRYSKGYSSIKIHKYLSYIHFFTNRNRCFKIKKW